MTVIQTTDFNSQLLIRQVQDSFDLLLKDNRSILSILIENGRSYQQGTNQKYEWLESQLGATKFTVTAPILLNAAPATTVVTFASTVGMEVGMILGFKDTNGIDIQTATDTLSVIVTNVINGTTADVVVMPGVTATTITSGSTATFTKGEAEDKKVFDAQNTRQPVLEYNQFQIFDQTVELSNTVINSLMYGDPNFVASQLKEAMYKMMQKIQVAVSDGVRVARGTAIGPIVSQGSLGGYKRFIDSIGGNIIDASAGNLTGGLINDAMQAILEQGGQANTIICNYQKAREISAFNTSGSNPNIERADRTTGSYVANFEFDMPVEGGLISRIVVDDKMSNDKVILTDINRMALVPFANRDLKLVDATLPGQDGKTNVLRAEYTLVVKDAKQSHAVIKNLS